MTFEISTPDSAPLFNTMVIDLRKRSDSGLDKASELVPAMLQQNILEGGARGGNPEWPRVPLFWLRQRDGWPDKDNFGAFTGAQLSYFTGHQKQEQIGNATLGPLFDTGKLFDSFQVMGKGDNEVTVGTPLTYGFQHEAGIPGPGGPKQLHQRVHMFIVESEDTDQLQEGYEGAFK